MIPQSPKISQNQQPWTTAASCIILEVIVTWWSCFPVFAALPSADWRDMRVTILLACSSWEWNGEWLSPWRLLRVKEKCLSRLHGYFMLFIHDYFTENRTPMHAIYSKSVSILSHSDIQKRSKKRHGLGVDPARHLVDIQRSHAGLISTLVNHARSIPRSIFDSPDKMAIFCCLAGDFHWFSMCSKKIEGIKLWLNYPFPHQRSRGMMSWCHWASDGQLADLHHGFFDGGNGLLDVRHQLGIIEDTAWNLAMATAKTQHQVQGGLLWLWQIAGNSYISNLHLDR